MSNSYMWHPEQACTAIEENRQEAPELDGAFEDDSKVKMFIKWCDFNEAISNSTNIYLDPPRVSNLIPQVCFWWLRGTNFTPLGESDIEREREREIHFTFGAMPKLHLPTTPYLTSPDHGQVDAHLSLRISEVPDVHMGNYRIF